MNGWKKKSGICMINTAKTNSGRSWVGLIGRLSDWKTNLTAPYFFCEWKRLAQRLSNFLQERIANNKKVVWKYVQTIFFKSGTGGALFLMLRLGMKHTLSSLNPLVERGLHWISHSTAGHPVYHARKQGKTWMTYLSMSSETKFLFSDDLIFFCKIWG